MDLLTGLLLIGVIIWITRIVILELFDSFIPESFAKYSRTTKNPIDRSLIGSVGRVVGINSNDSTKCKIRIGIELWNAKFASKTAQTPPIGTMVRVTAVNGMLLDIERHSTN